MSLWRDGVDFGIGYLFGSRRKRKGTDLFRQKIVITISPWAIPLFVLAVGTSVFFALNTFTNILCLVITFGCVFSAWRMRQNVQDLRYQVHKTLTDIEGDELESESEYGEYVERISVKDINGQRSTRVSER